ncbi:hypothetical protein F5884DRAFT_882622 [Xylogone sp. PMI_703]|nr:hypothetical protein F5884DRAFT_882622 [Xylogone sp. PMI_703]
MKISSFNLIYLTALAPVIQALSSLSGCPPRPASQAEQHKNLKDFANIMYVDLNVTAAFEKYVWVDYIQHNPSVPQGRDAAITYLTAVSIGTTFEVAHLGFDNSTGYIHHYNFGSSGSQIKIVDVYHFNGSCIVEHWDVIANLTDAELDLPPLSG